MKKSGVQDLEIWLVGILKFLKFQSGLWAAAPCTAPTSEDKFLQGAWPAEGEGGAMARSRGGGRAQGFSRDRKGRAVSSPRPPAETFFEIWRVNVAGSEQRIERSPPTDSGAKVCTANMSYYNLPTVLPSSPSKIRGQIQVRGLRGGRGWLVRAVQGGDPLR